jgi:DNA helicase IV
VDPGRRAAVDGRGLDAGTPSEDAGSIDVEELALLLELTRLKSGEPRGRGSAGLAHAILDEAQELSEVECAVLGDAVASDGCVTVAGDPAQQIGEHAVFRGWDPLMQALGRGRAAPVTLETSYRCTRSIVEFAHAVLGPLASGAPPVARREGAPVSRSRLPSELHASLLLAESLAELVDREPMAQVAIIAREAETAQRVYDALARQLAVRLVLDGRFEFRPGIDVTTVPQVKGLEFDYVVLPDVSAVDYPPDGPSRRMLHVAATRAIHQLWILTSSEWSPLVRDATI